MTTTDTHMARLDASATSSCFHYTHSLALTMALMVGSPLVADADDHVGFDNIQIGQQQSTNQAYTTNRVVEDVDLFLAINNIFETLASEQKELDVEVREIVEDNRWDLYL